MTGAGQGGETSAKRRPYETGAPEEGASPSTVCSQEGACRFLGFLGLADIVPMQRPPPHGNTQSDKDRPPRKQSRPLRKDLPSDAATDNGGQGKVLERAGPSIFSDRGTHHTSPLLSQMRAAVTRAQGTALKAATTQVAGVLARPAAASGQ